MNKLVVAVSGRAATLTSTAATKLVEGWHP
jgi:hypothetical protein